MRAPLFTKQLQDCPDALAITDLSHQKTWRELFDRVNALTHYFKDALGIQPGDHIALAVGNRIEHVEAMLAGQLAGAWVTPVNTHLSASEIDYIRRDCGARIVLCDTALQPLLLDNSCGRIINVETLGELPAAEAIDASAICGGSMLYTSGTTGRPKGVQRAKPNTVEQLLARMSQLGKDFGLHGEGPHLVTGPLYHAAPGMFALYDLINGAPMVILPKWDCELFLDSVQRFAVTSTHLVPTMFVRLLQAVDVTGSRPALSSLQYVMHGAAPIAPSVKRRMIEWWGPILTEYWGGTESGVVTLVNSSEWEQHPGTVGRPVANYEVFIGDRNGNLSDENEGLLFCRHRDLAQVFAYHNDPEKTVKAHPQPHVICIGDIGRVDDEGFVYLSDRESNMIISGGVNIYPLEVEQALMEHELITDAAVFGIPNEEWGEEVKAVVQLNPGTSPSSSLAEDIRQFTKQHIASFKVPRTVEFTEELPRNASGKILVRELRNQYMKQAS